MLASAEIYLATAATQLTAPALPHNSAHALLSRVRLFCILREERSCRISNILRESVEKAFQSLPPSASDSFFPITGETITVVRRKCYYKTAQEKGELLPVFSGS